MFKFCFAMSMAVVATSCAGQPVDREGDGPADTDAPAASPDEFAPPPRSAGWAALDLVPYAPPPAIAARVSGNVPLELWSRDELAEALRPVLSRPDGLFTTREPNWTAADTYRVASNGTEAAPLSPPGGPIELPPDKIQTAGAVIGDDGRLVVSNTTVAPFSAMARVVITLDTGVFACTGTYIGPWTFVLAGHCVRNSDGTVARRMRFEPGRNGASLPFGSFDCRNDDASTANDYLLAITAGFASTADPNLDFAVIDTFPCHHAPRWLGQPASNQGILVDSGTTTYSMHGYSGPPCKFAPSGDLFNCGMSGSAYVNGSWIETDQIDSDHGQSGAAWHVGGRVAATHIGYREYFDFFRCGFDVCRRNYARRIDAGYKSFIDLIAFDYP